MPRYRLALSLLTALGLAAGLVACGGAEHTGHDAEPAAPPIQVDLGAQADGAAEAIDGESMRQLVAELSSDELGGRAPGSDGDVQARQIIADALAAKGLRPGGPNGSWEQRFSMVGINADPPDTWTFTAGGSSVELAHWDEFIAASGVQSETAEIADAELVFVGYGIQAPEYEWDDYAGVDLTGKVLLMLNNDPEWDDDLFAGMRRLYYGRWSYKYESAAAQGAAGAIIIHTTPSAGYPFQVVQSSWTGEQFELPAEGEARVQVEAWVTEEAAAEIARLAGHDLATLVESARSRDFAPIPLGVTTSISLANQVREVETANVLGLLEGRDPELADEVVVYSAHYDHLGVGQPNAEGDSIYNGARDNASGVAQVIDIADAFQALSAPPRRSVLFALVGAEEQGLLGSEYYAQHPTFPPGKIAAVVNLDAGNIWGETEDVIFIGYDKSSLGGVVDEHAADQGRSVTGDQFPDKGFYYRSDQFSFAKIGVPGAYLEGGTKIVGQLEGWGKEQMDAWEAAHYHQPSDELTDDWSFEGMVQDARLAFAVGLDVAESDEIPTWKPGDEFEAARQEALAAVE